MATDLRLAEPTLELENAFLAMAEDYRKAGESRYQEELGYPFPEYLQKLKTESLGINLLPGYVPSSTFWLIKGFDLIVGVSRLRHSLTKTLEMVGGHIGYDVPPSQRRQGYGTKLLALTLPKARSLGLNRVLITCDSDNIGSSKVIIHNGGMFENEIRKDNSKQKVARYFIDLKEEL